MRLPVSFTLAVRSLPALAATLLLAGPASAVAKETGSLYDRMGGGPAITAIANDLVDESSSNPRTARSWHKVTLSRVKTVLTEYLCAISGGPCSYQGDTMKQIHAGLDIREDEMYAMVEKLRTIMIKHDVALRERNEMLALLAPSKRDVVTK